MENGSEIKQQPAEVRKTYSDAISNFYQELKLKCAQYEIDFIDADNNKGLEQVLLPYLLKRERLM